jgi:fibro-slime domain-containing protein
MLRKSLATATVLGALSALGCSAGSPAAPGSSVNGTGAGSGITGSGGSGNGSGIITGTGGSGSGIIVNPSGGDANGGATGNAAQQCDGKFKGYLRDFTIGDTNGNVIAPGGSTPAPLTAWWTPGATAPTAETVAGVTYVVSPDFEVVRNDKTGTKQYVADPGMVMLALGADQKPQYAGGASGTLTTTGPDNYKTWWNDTPGVNIGRELDLQFYADPTKPTDPNAYTFHSGPAGTACTQDKLYCAGFYPIDGMQLGNEGNNHNYHMTFELHLQFVYHMGQVFNFTGDDDVWVYINNKLAVDLGGVHLNASAPLNLDTLGLTEGTTYPLDFFWCERHVTASNFGLDTSLEIVSCGTVVK